MTLSVANAEAREDETHRSGAQLSKLATHVQRENVNHVRINSQPCPGHNHKW